MNNELLVTIGAVIVASVIGSLHCAGMCGAFVAMAVGTEQQVSRTRVLAAYNLGRLAVYSLIGAIAGSLGAAFDLGGRAVGAQRAAVLLAAATMITIGTISLLRSLGVRLPRVRLPGAMESLFIRLHRLAAQLTPTRRAATIGLLTGLLPCGWLYAFAILAAGTAHPIAGAVVMAAFWLGTLPILVSLGAGVRALSGALGRYAPGTMAVIILTLGILTALDRATLTFADVAPKQASATVMPVSTDLPCCHPPREPTP